jgi:hypothetical protein
MSSSRLFWILALAFILIAGVRLSSSNVSRHDLLPRDEYNATIAVDVKNAPGPFRLSLYIPNDGSRASVQDELIDGGGLDVTVVDEPAGRRLMIEGRTPGQYQIRYRASISVREIIYNLERDIPWSEQATSDTTYLGSAQHVQTNAPEIDAILTEIFMNEGPQPTDADGWRRQLDSQGISLLSAYRKAYDFCHLELAPASFSGTTDALTAARLREASCGGKSRLLVALCRHMGIPARLMGGVLLGDYTRKRAHHIWVEARVGNEWLPSDPLNGHFARLPGSYLQLYRGDEALISHSRGLAFDYGFRSKTRSVPALWRNDVANEGRVAIPLLRRNQFSALMLAPFALLMLVFARQVIGMESIGTFLPILLGYAFLNTGLLQGLTLVAACILGGTLLRSFLMRFTLLAVPRAALLIVFVIATVLAQSYVLEWLGMTTDVVAVLPLAATAMTIERFTTAAMDRGVPSALRLLTSTLLLAIGCLVVLRTVLFQNLTVVFPEILLLVAAEIVMIGDYRGLRLKELWRFRDVVMSGDRP